MIYSFFNVNYDIYLRDYLLSLTLNDLNSIVTLGSWFYVFYTIIGLTFSSIVISGISNCLSGVYTSNLYSYFVTPIIEVMYNVHKEYYIILTSILIIILYVLCIELKVFRDIAYRYSINNNFALELVWSVLPALIILHFMLMTIALLYIADEHAFFGFQVKVIGHQWYWEYDIAKCFSSIESMYTNMSEAILPEYSSKAEGFQTKSTFELDYMDYVSMATIHNQLVKHISYIKYDAERLLDTEGVLYVPYHTHVRLLVTSMDVIHAFTIPSLGIKADAIPGRLNDLHFFLTDNSAMTHYFGQCSELCGVGHAFMPIHMVSI